MELGNQKFEIEIRKVQSKTKNFAKILEPARQSWGRPWGWDCSVSEISCFISGQTSTDTEPVAVQNNFLFSQRFWNQIYTTALDVLPGSRVASVFIRKSLCHPFVWITFWIWESGFAVQVLGFGRSVGSRQPCVRRRRFSKTIHPHAVAHQQSLLIHLQGYWGDARKQFPASGEVVVLSKHSCEHHRELSAGTDTHFLGLCISQVGFRKRSQGRDKNIISHEIEILLQ